jgi:drug/metabolite transporter (DMT)-like permease
VTTLAPRTVWATAAAAACASIFFGASVTATRYVVADLDPLLLAFLRYFIAAVCLVPFVLVRQRARVPAPDLLRIAMLGIVFFGLFPWLFSAGLQYIPASRGAVWLATMPFLTFALAVALRYETFTSMKAWGIALATLGVVLALSPGGGGSSGDQSWLGDLLLFGTACCGAIYFVLSRGVLRRQPALLVTCLSMISGATFLALLTLASGEAQLPRLGAAGWAAVVFLGTFGAAVGFSLWVWALQRMTPTRTAVFLTLNPIAATSSAALLLGEEITAAFLFGLLLVLAGIVMANVRPRARRLTPAVAIEETRG